MQYNVYGIGNALLDIQYDVDFDFLIQNELPKGLMSYLTHPEQEAILDRLGRNNVRQISSGGSVANSMVVMSQFGAKCFFSCRIANDASGDEYYQEMKDAGLNNNFDNTARPDGLTGRCIVKVTPDADRTMSTYLGTSIELCEDQLNVEALKQSEYLYIEGYLTTSPSAMKAVKKAISIAKENNVKIAITLSDPDIVSHFREQFHELIDQGVDLIFCNEKEAIDFTETNNLDEAEEKLKHYTKTFVVTIGPRGSIVFDGNRLLTVTATEEQPIDTLGAGDMYAGAFLFAITNGYSWEDAGRLANLTSSKVVTMFGPRVSADHTKELIETLHSIKSVAA